MLFHKAKIQVLKFEFCIIKEISAISPLECYGEKIEYEKRKNRE